MRLLFILAVFCLVLTHCGPSDEASEAETAKTETAKTETAKTETAETETPKTETPKTETPKAETAETETAKAETAETETPKTETPKTETPKKAEAVVAVGSFDGVYTGVLLGSKDVKVYINSILSAGGKKLEQLLVHIALDKEKLCTLLRDVKSSGLGKVWFSGITSNRGSVDTYQSVSVSLLEDKPNSLEVRLYPVGATGITVENLTKTKESVPSFDELKKDCGF